MERLFNLDAQLLFDTVLLAVAVFFLFMLMSYLLFNPARKLLKDRQDRIESRELLMNRSQQRMTGKRQPFTKKNTNRN